MKFRDKYFFLSNMYPCKIEYKGYIFPSSENLYQFLKIPENLQHEYINIFTKISPFEAKQLGKRIPIRKDWKNIKINVMKFVLELKFKDKNLLSKLKNIEGEIVEHNEWGDRFWGKDLNGNGENHLGKLLMEIRDGGLF